MFFFKSNKNVSASLTFSYVTQRTRHRSRDQLRSRVNHDCLLNLSEIEKTYDLSENKNNLIHFNEVLPIQNKTNCCSYEVYKY